MMLVTYERYSYESLSKSQIPSLYSRICRYGSDEVSSGSYSLILAYDNKPSRILVRIIARHYTLSTEWADKSNFTTYLKATSLFHYSTKRGPRKIYDRLITIKCMYAKIGSVPLNFRGIEPDVDEDDYDY